jgi:hypothetical protein
MLSMYHAVADTYNRILRDHTGKSESFTELGPCFEDPPPEFEMRFNLRGIDDLSESQYYCRICLKSRHNCQYKRREISTRLICPT